MVGTNVGVKKSMHSILGTREDRELTQIQGYTKNDDENSNKDNNFKYDSDLEQDTIDFRCWNTKKFFNKLDKRNDNNENSDETMMRSHQTLKTALMQYKKRFQREAISVGMKSNRKRSKRSRGGNNDENNTKAK